MRIGGEGRKSGQPARPETGDETIGASGSTSEGTGPLDCPFCGAYEIDRMYLGTIQLDACTCQACGSRWDQDAVTGEYRGRGSGESVVAPRRT